MLYRLEQNDNVNRFISPSLKQRLASESWFENRVIRYVLQESPWIRALETTFQAADLDSVLNSSEIFGVLNGTTPDYDKSLFDALGEVRLVAWARRQCYSAIEKLQTNAGHSTPDFRMERGGKVFLAEAKHFQVRDYLVYFVADRLEGLALKTDTLKQFGLVVEMGSKYAQKRDDIRKNRSSWVANTRRQLTEEAFLELLWALEGTPNKQQAILDGLFLVERSDHTSPRRVFPDLMGTLDPEETVEWCLSRLQDELLDKLRQIKGFMAATGAQADRAIVFFSGIDEWEPEWAVLWEALEGRETQVWDHVDAIYQAARRIIGLPFDLIVGRYQKKGREPSGEVQDGSMEYVPFSWRLENVSS